MTCFYCRGDMRESVTVYTVQLETCLVVIRNVPCFECAQCGEVEISDETMRSLERIVDTCKKLVQEVAVVDYRMAA
ncbi:MAG: type II toxin-antitoxin system MqsA family antitoxin [Atopobiaceae bacterium]|nr:type II toxin-antitoxin system MqsA family antitoxin [Atopobiaceae bacterium]